MIEYEIIDEKDFPGILRGQWQQLLISLPSGKAIKFTYASQVDAENARNSILGSFRYNRRNKREWVGMRLVTTINRVNDNEWALFVKKVKEEGNA